MIYHWTDDETGLPMVELHCGCCGQYFDVVIGGSAFCAMCLHSLHTNCKVAEIMGTRHQ